MRKIETLKGLEGYLSKLKMEEDSKRKYRKAIRDFLAMLEERGKSEPDESDYADFHVTLLETANEATAKDRENKVRKYFAWLEELREKEEKRKKTKGRFTLMLSPSLREDLEILSQFRRCSVTEILIGLAEKCVKENASNIESMKDFYREHGAGVNG